MARRGNGDRRRADVSDDAASLAAEVAEGLDALLEMADAGEVEMSEPDGQMLERALSRVRRIGRPAKRRGSPRDAEQAEEVEAYVDADDINLGYQ